MTYNPLPGWEISALTALTLAGIILAIVYGISRVLNNGKMKAWAISEVGQFVASGLIIGSLIVIIDGIMAIASALTGTPDIYKYAIDYITSVQVLVGGLSASVFTLNMLLGAIQKISINVIVGIQPFSGLSGITSSLDMMTQWLFVFGAMAELQKGIILFAQTTALSYILPVGVILRTLPFTRVIGGFLMALAIGLAVVFPLTYAFADFNMQHFDHTVVDQIQNKTATLTAKVNPFTLLDGGLSVDKTVEYVKNAAAFLSYTDIGIQIDMIRAAIAEIAISLILLPLVGFIVTVLFIKQLTGILGGEINLNFIERL